MKTIFASVASLIMMSATALADPAPVWIGGTQGVLCPGRWWINPLVVDGTIPVPAEWVQMEVQMLLGTITMDQEMISFGIARSAAFTQYQQAQQDFQIAEADWQSACDDRDNTFPTGGPAWLQKDQIASLYYGVKLSQGFIVANKFLAYDWHVQLQPLLDAHRLLLLQDLQIVYDLVYP